MIPIVNDIDEIINFKDRNELDYDNDIYRSTAIWVYNSDNEVLIAQRKLTKTRQPGKWGPSAAGTVEENETYDSNAIKELEEEIGVANVTLRSLDKIRTDDSVHQFTQWYVVKVDQPENFFNPQLEEVEKVLWVSRDELIADYNNNPEKYVNSMHVCIDMLNRVFNK